MTLMMFICCDDAASSEVELIDVYIIVNLAITHFETKSRHSRPATKREKLSIPLFTHFHNSFDLHAEAGRPFRN